VRVRSRSRSTSARPPRTASIGWASCDCYTGCSSEAGLGDSWLSTSLPRCSLRGSSGARHASAAARGSAPPIPYAVHRARRCQVGTGKQAPRSNWKTEFGGHRLGRDTRRPQPMMYSCSGPPMQFLSVVDSH
jgi:hypothetical protein